MAERLGLRYRACGAVYGSLTGNFVVRTGEDAVKVLRNAGASASVSDGVLSVGCGGGAAGGDPSATALGAAPAQVPQPEYLPGGPVDVAALQGPFPQAQGPVQSSPPPEPELEKAVVLRPAYLTVRSLRDLFKGMPGISLLASDTVPGGVVVVGGEKAVAQARDVFEQLDACPAVVHVDAAVYSRGERVARDRSVGLALRAGGLNIGSTRAPAGAALSFENATVTAFADAGVDVASVVEVFRTSGQALLGEPVRIADGQDIPVRAATVITDRETTQSVVYRTAGHSLDITVTSAALGQVAGSLTHEVSSPGQGSELGPSFATRKVQSAFRVPEGRAVVFALSGLARESSSRELRLLGIGRAKELQSADGLLVLRFAVDQCVTTRETARVQ